MSPLLLGQRRGVNLFSTLKHDLGLDDDAETRISPQHLQRDLAFWIEAPYNPERFYSTIGNSAESITSRSSSTPVHAATRSPDQCLPNGGNASQYLVEGRCASMLFTSETYVIFAAPCFDKRDLRLPVCSRLLIDLLKASYALFLGFVARCARWPWTRLLLSFC